MVWLSLGKRLWCHIYVTPVDNALMGHDFAIERCTWYKGKWQTQMKGRGYYSSCRTALHLLPWHKCQLLVKVCQSKLSYPNQQATELLGLPVSQKKGFVTKRWGGWEKNACHLLSHFSCLPLVSFSCLPILHFLYEEKRWRNISKANVKFSNHWTY